MTRERTIILTMFIIFFMYINVIEGGTPPTSFIPRLARVSALDGKAYFQGANMIEWGELLINMPIRPGDRVATDEMSYLELELDDGNYFRMADSSKLDILSMDMNEEGANITTRLRLWMGDFYGQIQGDTRYNSTFIIDTSSAKLEIGYNTIFRVTVFEDGAFQLKVYRGEINVAGRSGYTNVRRRQMLIVDSRGNMGDVEGFEWWVQDDFDKWNKSRREFVRRFESHNRLNGSFRSGYSDLDHYGNWVYVQEYGNVWVPTVSAGWVPYRYGRWIYITPWGWTWVSSEPWGWIPYHYGSWSWTIDFGWIWVPGYYWSPGWVSWYFGNGYIGWIAYHPWDYHFLNFSFNYCFWFPYNCYHHGGYHEYHNYHAGTGYGNIHTNSYDHNYKNTFLAKYSEKYGNSVPINSTHKMGIDPATTIKAVDFFKCVPVTENTSLVPINLDPTKRPWTNQLPEISSIASETGVPRSMFSSIPAYKQHIASKSQGKRIHSRNSISKFSNAGSKNNVRSVKTSTSKRESFRSNTNHSTSRETIGTRNKNMSLDNKYTGNPRSRNHVSSNRTKSSGNSSTIHINNMGKYRSYRTYSRTKTNKTKNQLNRGSRYQQTRSRKNYRGYARTGKTNTNTQYKITPKQSGITGIINTLLKYQKNGSVNTSKKTSTKKKKRSSSKKKTNKYEKK